MPAVAGKILGYQYALSNAVPYLDDSDDGDRKLIDLANQFDGMVAGSNGNA